MKKKKILLGLALAAAAVFSLASCGDDTKPADNGGSQVTPEQGGDNQGGGEAQTQKYSVTYHTTHGTAPAAVADVTALPATLPTLTDDEYNFLGWSKTENGTTLVTAGSAISANTDLYAVWQEKEKFTITYHTDHGTAPDNLANVRALPETLPTLTDTDYNFVGWAATENGTELVTAGSAITANADLYAVWTEKAMYDKVVARGTANQTLKINEAFSETDSIELIDDFDEAIEAKLYQKVSTKGSPKDGSAYSMTVENGVAKANDNDVTIQNDDGTNNGKILNIINFGQAAKTVEGYYDVELPVAAGSWTFFVINGSDTAKASGEIFGLRTVKVTENKTDKIYLKYRVDGGSETNPETSIELTNNIKLGVHYVINVETQKITIEIVTFDANNNQTVNKFVTDLEIAGLKALDYSYLQTSDKNSNLFNIDNIVLNVGYKTLAEVKAYYSGLLESKATALSQDANYSFSYDMFTSELASNKEAIEESETIAEVIEAYKNSSLLNPVTDADLKALYVKILTDAKETLEDSYVYNATAFNNIFEPKIAAINNATTADAFSTAVEAANGYATELAAIEPDPVVRSKRLTEYTTYYAAQAKAITDLNLDTTEYTAAMLKLVSVTSKYVSQDAENPEPTTFQGCAITDIDDLLAAAKGELDAIVAEYSLSVTDLIATYNAAINLAKNQGKAVVKDDVVAYFGENIDKISTLDATQYENSAAGKAKAKTDYEAVISQIDAIVADYAKKKTAVDGLEEYIAEQVATLKDTETYNSTYKSQMDDIVELCWLELEDDKTDLEIAATIDDSISGVDSLIADIKAATETNVRFMLTDNINDIYLQYNVIKGSKLTKPTDPTMDGFAFVSWDWDFDNGVVADSVVRIYPTWHDTYESTAAATSTATFKGMSALPIVNEVTFGAKNKTVNYTVNGITYTSTNTSDANFGIEANGLKMNKAGQKISFEVTAGSTVTFVLRNGKSDGTRAFNISSTSGLQLNNIIKGYTLPTGITGVTVTNGKALDGTTNEQECTKIVITCDTAQTLTIECAGTSPNTVHIQQISVSYNATIRTEIKEIKASIANDANLISVSNVKLIDIDDNEIAITEGYDVSVVNSANEVVDNWQDALPAGNYKVYVQYGSYTQIVGLVQINGMA